MVIGKLWIVLVASMAGAKRFFDDFFFAAFLCDINRGLRTRMPSSAWKITRKLRCKQKANIYEWMENCAMNKQNRWNESAKENKWQFLTMFRNDTPPRVSADEDDKKSDQKSFDSLDDIKYHTPPTFKAWSCLFAACIQVSLSLLSSSTTK